MPAFRASRFAAILLLPLAIVAASCEPSPRPVATYPRRNVLIVSVDTLRPDHLGAYGYSRPTSPNVDELAKQSIVFEHAFAPRGMTWPSLATMLTSQAPTTTNVRWNGQYMPAGIPTTASVLKESGYRVGAFLGGSICHMARATATFTKLACGDDDYVTSRAIEFFRTTTDQPAFAWLHLMATHAPYEPPAEHDLFTKKDYVGPVDRTRFALDAVVSQQTELGEADLAQLLGLYDGEVHSADAEVGLLMKALDELGKRKDTIVVFTADHGEDLYEHNRYLYHACSVYDSALRIPMILSLPDGSRAGTRYRDIVEVIDLAPTLLELVGVAAPASFEGKSMVARLNGGSAQAAGDAAPKAASAAAPMATSATARMATSEAEPMATSEWYDPNLRQSLQTVRTAKWRYVSNPEGLTPKCVPPGDYYKVAREELYDLVADPREQRNVVAKHPDIAKELATHTQKGHAASNDDAPLPVDPKLKEELKSLGYLE